MDHLGYIKLYRRLFDSTLWSLPPDELRLAVYLLLRARHSTNPKKLPGVEVKRGEIITSLMDIAEACEWHENRRAHRWSKQKVARMLKALSEIGFLTHKSDTYGTHLSLCNYDTYQGGVSDNADAGGTPADGCGTPADASGPIQEGEECLNGKNEKKKTARFVPPTIDDITAYGEEKGLVDLWPEKIHGHYEMKGWMAGRNKMKCWKSAVSNAHRDGWGRKQGQGTLALDADESPAEMRSRLLGG